MNWIGGEMKFIPAGVEMASPAHSMLVREEHPKKGKWPILVILSGITINSRKIHPEKAKLPIVLTVCGITIDSRDLH
jgi:hypothetical protein